jgi:nitrate/nitrite transporter NarK
MTSITKLSILTGVALILLGAAFYVGTGMKSMTAMIPAFFGIPIVLCGLLARDEKKRMMAAHIAALVGVLGALGGLGMGIPKLIKGSGGNAAIAQLIMGVICVIYVVACVRSFIAARKARQA